MYNFYLRSGVYCLLGAVTVTGLSYTNYGLLMFTVVGGFIVYMLTDTYKSYTFHYSECRDRNAALMFAISDNVIDIGVLIMTLIIGIFLGVS